MPSETFDPAIGQTKTDPDGIEYEWRGKMMGWRATGKPVPGMTNTPHYGEPEGSRDRKPTDSLIQERNTTHGDFDESARISQELKSTFERQRGYAALSPVQRESLDMIALKVSRILSGKPDEPDHWDDIAGYARLASKSRRA